MRDYLPFMHALGDYFKVKSIKQDIPFSRMGEYVIFNVEFDPEVTLDSLIAAFPTDKFHKDLKVEITHKANNKGTIKLFTPPLVFKTP